MAELDRDLRSLQEVRDKLDRAESAYQSLRDYSEAQVNEICTAMAAAVRERAREFAEKAVAETGFGDVDDKVQKNLFSTDVVLDYVLDVNTTGVIARDDELGVFEIAVPVGIVAGITPSTNPTSTAIYKALIAVKARNPILFSPHPDTAETIYQLCDLMQRAAAEAGAPAHTVQSVRNVTLEGSEELMGHEKTGIILATGGKGMVRAAYSSGNPALGVGPGNVPAYIHRSATVEKSVDDVIASKTFDWGVICSSEQSIVCDRQIGDQVRQRLRERKCHFVSQDQREKLRDLMVSGGGLNPEVVGRPPWEIARMAGFEVPEGTPMLVVEMERDQVGPDHPLSMEKLSPVICLYEVEDWHDGCELCIEIIEYGGVGHTLVVHSHDDDVIEQFALEKPVFRILANTPAAQGSIGLTTNLAPAMTLGSGTWGGSSSSDNITPLHLINRKRLAYESVPWESVKSSEESYSADAGSTNSNKSTSTSSSAGSSNVARPASNSSGSPSGEMVGLVKSGPSSDAHSGSRSTSSSASSGSSGGAGDSLEEDKIRRMVEDFLERRKGS